MRIAIAGGTGVVGSRVVRLAEEAGHETLVLSRSRGVDLAAGSGLDLRGVDAVVDASGPATTSAAKSRTFFEAVTRGLLRAEADAGVAHHIALSIVGAAGIARGYYAGKALQEQVIAASGRPWTILRTTQFFEFAEQNAMALGPWRILPRMRSRPLAAETVAERLLEIAEGPPLGNAPDLAGPDEIAMAELLREILRARGERPRVLEVPLPGGFGRALRDGSILPGPEAEIRGPSAAEWIAAR